MQCPKCGNEVKNNSLRCDFCNTKVNMICPECKSLNPFGIEFCLTCHAQLLKYCSHCNSVNLHSAQECRKCRTSLIKREILTEQVEKEQSDLTPVEGDISKNELTNKIEEIHEESIFEIIEEINEPTEPQEELVLHPEEQEVEEESVDAFLNFQNTEVEPEIELRETVSSKLVTEELHEENNIDEAKTNIENDKNEEEIKKESETKQNTSDTKENASVNDINYYSQIQAMQRIVNTVKYSRDKFIIAVNGSEGSGKSIVLQHVMKELQTETYISIFGECTPLSQISNFGFFQDAMIKLLGLPGFITNPEIFIKNNKKVFENIFSHLSTEEIIEFMNFLYPHKKGLFEEIILNKERTFEILEKIIKSILEKNKIAIVVDDFDIIDGASYDFIMHLVEKGYFDSNIKLIISYKEQRIAQSFFYSNILTDKVYENIYLEHLSQDQMDSFVQNFVNGESNIIPEEIKNELYENCESNASYLEQSLALLHDKKFLEFSDGKIIYNLNNPDQNILPKNICLVVKERIKLLTPTMRSVLFFAATIGYKFDIQILLESISHSLTEEQMNDSLKYLQENMFITQQNQYTYSFKGISLWRYIYDESKASDLYIDTCVKIYEVLKNCVLSNNSVKAIVAQGVLTPIDMIGIWGENADLSNYIGDVNLYVISQKQRLKLATDNNIENANALKNDICEKIGKILYKTNPTEAIGYLSNSISNAKKENDTIKIIDLCGYLITSCYATCNFYGVIESVDMITQIIKTEVDDIELALIKSRKIKALFSVGNCEEVINIARNDIIPTLEEYLSRPQPDKVISSTLIYESWLETSLILSNAYSAQGSDKAIEVVDNVVEIMDINKLDSKYYKTKAAISKAFALTMIGKIKDSYRILEEITREYIDDVLANEFLAQWNLIHIINRILTNNFDGLREELFSLATFANNINDSFTKNLVKTILGYLIHRDGDLAKALDIYNEQVTYFAKEKIATGALLCWQLISQITLTIDGADKALDIANKALDVAQNPKINNYSFAINLQKFIAEIYMIKGDLDATKMYIEKALLTAKQLGSKYSQVDLYLAFAKYYEESISMKPVNKSEKAMQAIKMYEYAKSIAIEIDLENLIAQVSKERAAFKTYCQLNSISV